MKKNNYQKFCLSQGKFYLNNNSTKIYLNTVKIFENIN